MPEPNIINNTSSNEKSINILSKDTEPGEIKQRCPRGPSCYFINHKCLYKHTSNPEMFLYNIYCKNDKTCPGKDKICDLDHSNFKSYIGSKQVNDYYKVPPLLSMPLTSHERATSPLPYLPLPPLPPPPSSVFPINLSKTDSLPFYIDIAKRPTTVLPSNNMEITCNFGKLSRTIEISRNDKPIRRIESQNKLFIPFDSPVNFRSLNISSPTPRDISPPAPKYISQPTPRYISPPAPKYISQPTPRDIHLHSRDERFSSRNRSRSRERHYSSRDRNYNSSRDRSRSRDRHHTYRDRSRSRDRHHTYRDRSRSRDRRHTSRDRSRSRDRHHTFRDCSHSRDHHHPSGDHIENKVIDRTNLVIPYVNDKISICKNGQRCNFFRQKICHFMHPSQIDYCFDLYEKTGDIMKTINTAKDFKEFAIKNRDANPDLKKFNQL